MLSVTAAYVLSFAVVDSVVTPLQARVLPEVTESASLLFLPHGVRVLAAWAWGWRAVPLLAPGALATTWHYHGAGMAEPAILASLAVSVVAAPLAFALLARCGIDCRFGSPRAVSWRAVMAVAALAGIINTGGSALIHGDHPGVTLVRLVGDVTGAMLVFLVLMAGFRLARLWRPGTP